MRERTDKQKFTHRCNLAHEEDIIVRYIDSGWFVYCRRRFRQFLLASENHPTCKEVFKSTAAVRQERARHLQHYYWVVHPLVSVERAGNFL